MNKAPSQKETMSLSLEKLAFLPAALEIQAAPPPKWSRSLLWALMGLIIAAVIWASWAEIDIIATAQGKIVPSGYVKVIQPLETGVVKEIFVKEGQHVRLGDKLIALDSSSNQSDIDRLKNEWTGLTQELTRQNSLLKKIDGEKENGSQILPVTKDSILQTSWHEYSSRKDSYFSEISKLNAERKAIEVNVTRLEKILPLVAERAQSLNTLLAESLVARTQYLELEQQRIDKEESLNYEKAKIEQVAASIIAAKQNLDAYIAEYRRILLQDISQLTIQSTSINAELNKAIRLKELRTLTAPVDGVVEELVVTTIGGIVTPAQELLRIVPNDQKLEIEAGLLNKDIGFVYIGQTAEVKIDSFPFTKYGVIDSKIINVSTDAVEHEQLGLLFPLKATLEQGEINVDGRMVKLIPGMSVTVEIKTGKRRLMEFLLAPLMRGVSEGARER